jgi:hypothetical protein
MKSNTPAQAVNPAANTEKQLITPDRYGNLVRNHFRVLSMKRGIALKAIPPGEFEALGAKLNKNGLGVVMIEVIMPSNLSPSDLDKIITDLEKETLENPCPEGCSDKKRNRAFVGGPSWGKRHKDSPGKPKKQVVSGQLARDTVRPLCEGTEEAAGHPANIEKAGGKGARQLK